MKISCSLSHETVENKMDNAKRLKVSDLLIDKLTYSIQKELLLKIGDSANLSQDDLRALMAHKDRMSHGC